ncbi:MAG: helix-hairpin-helix domain-containing protein [Sphingobacteriales bacterium]|nr:MAG: helix-hairpin-helix domain-containing protein [Sphingobacteriales bacterium]
MKRVFLSYLSFNRTERMGIAALIILLSAFLVTKMVAASNILSAKNNSSQQNRANYNGAIAALSQPSAAEHRFLKDFAANAAGYTTAGKTAEHNKTEQVILKPFPFDPNTLDSAGFRRMGLPAKTTAILLHWRASGKHFYHPDDMKTLYTLKPEQFGTLKPFIRIPKISLNHADSLALVRLRGIGPKLAHKILEKRATEPFTSLEQLRTLQRIPDTVYTQLTGILTID